MNDDTLTLVIMVLGCALPLIICGYLVAVKQMRNLISGWDETKYSDPKAFGNAIGYSCIRLGIFIGIIAIAWYSKTISETTMAIILIIVTFIEFFNMFKTYNSFKK
jgi:hypothetical protein